MAAVVTLAITACGGPPDLSQTLDGVRSWTASTLLAAHDRRSDAIGKRYAEGLAERATEALAEQRATLAQAAKSPRDRVTARQVIDSLAGAIERLRAEMRR